MKIIQSLWTTPMLKNRWGVQNQLLMNLWLYALSINYIKNLNIPTVLYTDDLGKEIFNILNKVIVLDKIICLAVLVYLTFSSLLKPLFSLYSTSCLFNPSIVPPS